MELLHSSTNKSRLIEFFFNDWQGKWFLQKLCDRLLHVTSGTKCIALQKDEIKIVPNLKSIRKKKQIIVCFSTLTMQPLNDTIVGCQLHSQSVLETNILRCTKVREG